MNKWVQTGTSRKTVGAYLKVVKALNELQQLGEDTSIFWTLDGDAVVGITGSIIQDEEGRWRFCPGMTNS